jgi:hypothetical protein
VLDARLRRCRVLPMALLLVGACAGDHRDWAFVQSVGGMALGTPYQTPEGVKLPVRVDVTGSRTITTPPTALNSGLAIKEIRVRRNGSNVRLELLTAVAGKGSSSSSRDVLLGNLEPGRYAIQYAEPNGGTVALGEIRVAPPRQPALEASTQVGEWVGEQTISEPLQSDVDGLRERVRWVDARVRSLSGNAALSGRLPDLELLQRLVDGGGIGPDETFHLQSLGLVLGDVLVSELGFHWVVVEDRYGRDLAVKFKDTSVLIFPLTMISKRIERGERPDVRHLFESAKKDLPRYVERSDPKPG